MRTEVGFTLIAVFAAAMMALAAEPPTLEVTAPDTSVRVGDRLAVQIVARGGEDLLWGELQVIEEPGGPWAVVGGPRALVGTRPPAWDVELAPMAVGEIELPEMTVVVRDASGEPLEVRAGALPRVDVASVLPDDEEVQPAPLRGPIGVSGFPWEWVLPLAMPVLGAAVALGIWARRRSQGDLAGVPALAPFDEFAALLDRLDERVGREPAPSVCDPLASGLRRYFERTSGKPAADMTTFELRIMAREAGWPETVQRGIQGAMGVADRVRFGRISAEDRELRQAIEMSRQAARHLEEHRRPDEGKEAVE